MRCDPFRGVTHTLNRKPIFSHVHPVDGSQTRVINKDWRFFRGAHSVFQGRFIAAAVPNERRLRGSLERGLPEQRGISRIQPLSWNSPFGGICGQNSPTRAEIRLNAVDMICPNPISCNDPFLVLKATIRYANSEKEFPSRLPKC